MKRFVSVLSIFCIAGIAAPGWAATSNLRADASMVQNPVAGQVLRITVNFTNLGPDAYPGSLAVGSRVGITVDIDDPTKPGLPGMAAGCTGNVTGNFDVPVIPVNGSAAVDVGAVGHCSSTDVRVKAIVKAIDGVIDPVAANDTSITVVNLRANTPATSWFAVAALAGFLLLAGAVWAYKRRTPDGAAH